MTHSSPETPPQQTHDFQKLEQDLAKLVDAIGFGRVAQGELARLETAEPLLHERLLFSPISYNVQGYSMQKARLNKRPGIATCSGHFVSFLKPTQRKNRAYEIHSAESFYALAYTLIVDGKPMDFFTTGSTDEVDYFDTLANSDNETERDYSFWYSKVASDDDPPSTRTRTTTESDKRIAKDLIFANMAKWIINPESTFAKNARYLIETPTSLRLLQDDMLEKFAGFVDKASYKVSQNKRFSL